MADSGSERRESRERSDVKSDTGRRERRESRERSDVESDTGRRERRESLERSDVRSDTGRRRHRESQQRKEREQVQAQLLQAQRLESLGQLAGGVAHDFNNLLAVILSYASFVSEELANPSGPDWPERLDSARSDLGQITLAAERAASLTRQLLTFARREVVRPQVLNLDDVITGVQELLHRTLGEHIELITTLAGDLWPVLADPGQLEQVLVNLAVNARDAMPGGGTLTIDTSNITVDAHSVAAGSQAPQGKNVRLRISDTGVGIPADVLEHVFEPFFTTKQDGSGTGLGLATVYGILAQAEGQIQLYTEPGTGTTFTITLPVTEQALVPVNAPVPYHRSPKGETVLVVEDEEALRLVTQRIFTRNGYHVITAADGPAALDIARAHPGEIHLLVTDVVMPRMLGKEVAERMRAIKPGIKVLFMSGYARPVLASQGSLERNVALVEKPFSEAELLSLAGQVLNSDFPGFETVDDAEAPGGCATPSQAE
jgi:signal transduction histidine kinase